MRRLIVSNLMSLDGLFEEAPDATFDWPVVEEEFFSYAREMLRSIDTILFGRRTYLHMAAYWPSAPRDEIADQMNNLDKVVFSRTLERADWKKSRLVRGDAAEEVAKLKRAAGRDMVILGSASLASSLQHRGVPPRRVGIAHGLRGAVSSSACRSLGLSAQTGWQIRATSRRRSRRSKIVRANSTW